MPELPEVETVRAGLAPALEGRTITRLQLNRADLRIPFPPELVTTLEGARITHLRRRAKYLLMQLDRPATAIIHLGMSGRMLLHPAAVNHFDTHDHVAMTLNDGQMLVFNDARRFGLWTLANAKHLNDHPLLAHLGPEPLEKGFTGEYLHQALAKRGAEIKPVLMDQKLVVGVGNIYASEALFGAKIHPQRAANSLSLAECVRLVACIQSVLRAAIVSGGSTLRDFVRSSGDIGYFQHHFAVYGRGSQPCTVCGTPIAQITQAARSSFFCPVCQPQNPSISTPKKRRPSGK